MRLFGKSKKKDPKKVVADCLVTVRKEKRQVERQIQTLQREEEKAMQVIKQASRNGQTRGCHNIAAAILTSRKMTRRLQTVKFRLDSVEINLQQQRSLIRQSGEVEASADVMRDMNELVKAPELTKAVQKMAKQLQKLGLMEDEMQSAAEAATDVLGDVALDDGDENEEIEKIIQNATSTGKRSARDELMRSRAMSIEPTAGASEGRRVAANDRRSVSVIEHTSAAKRLPRAQLLLD